MNRRDVNAMCDADDFLIGFDRLFSGALTGYID